MVDATGLEPSDLLHVKHLRVNAVLRPWEAERKRLSYTVTSPRLGLAREAGSAHGPSLLGDQAFMPRGFGAIGTPSGRFVDPCSQPFCAPQVAGGAEVLENGAGITKQRRVALLLRQP